MLGFEELNQRFQSHAQSWLDDWYDQANTWADRIPVGERVVLDAGIGTGLLTRRVLKANPGMTLIGVEYDKGYCEQAYANLKDHARSIRMIEPEEFDPGLLDTHHVVLVHDNLFSFAPRFGKRADRLLLANLHWYSPHHAQPDRDDRPGNQACHINQMAFSTLVKYTAPKVVKDGGTVLQVELSDKNIDEYFMHCEQSTCSHYKAKSQQIIGMMRESNGNIYRPVITEKINRHRTFDPTDVVTDKTAELCKDVLCVSYDPTSTQEHDRTRGMLILSNQTYRIENPIDARTDDVTVYCNGKKAGALQAIACPLNRKCQVYYTEKLI